MGLAPLLYPIINGHRYSWASVEIKIGGTRFVGIKEVSYSQELEPGEVRGAHPQLIGRTRGTLKPEASLTLFEEEWNTLLETLGDGYYEKSFDVVVSYSESDPLLGVIAGTITDTIRGCRIKKVEKSRSEGNDGLEVKLDLSVLWIEFNGKQPLRESLLKIKLG